MNCLLCGHDKVHKHGKTEKGQQRYKCPCCGKTFPEHFDSLYYGRHLTQEEVHTILQAQAEGSSLRGVSRISGRAYGTVVSLIRSASQKALMIHNQEVKQIETEEVIADEMWSSALKKQKNCCPEELMVGDCWIGLSLAGNSGLIMAARVGKHTDAFIAELFNSTEGKTDCLNWKTDGWGGYERVLAPEINHQIGKENTQRLERTNGIIRQQTGRWHQRQNKFAKIWEQTKVTVRLVVSYFNWIWVHSRLGTTAAQRSGLTESNWTWNDLATYPTLL